MGADRDRGGFTRWADLGRLLELDGDLTLERALLAADGEGRPEHDPGRRARSLLRRMGAFAAGALTAVGAMTVIGRLDDSPSQERLRPEESAAPAGLAAVDRPEAVVLTLSPKPAPVDPSRHRPKGKGSLLPAAAVARPMGGAAAGPATPLSAHVLAVHPAPAAHHRAPAAASALVPTPELVPEPTAQPAPILKPVGKRATKPIKNPVTTPVTTPTATPVTKLTATPTPTPTCTDTKG
jgi:hypothetical protein